MPVIAVFYGIVIRVYHADHAPPHVHVQYGEYEAIYEIKTARSLYGKMPPRVESMIKEWIKLRQSDIQKAWDIAQAHKIPKRVKPLE